MDESSAGEITDYNSIKNWTLGLSETYKGHYLRYFGLFCEFTKRDPDLLVQWARKDRTKAHHSAKQFYYRLADLNFSAGTRFTAYWAVRSFFLHNDCPFGRAPRPLRMWPKIRGGRLLKPREVCDLISCARHVRSKAMISLLAQSGQRVGLISALRYGHVRDQIERAISPVVVEVNYGIDNGRDHRANKGRTNYRFAFGKESRDYIIQMLNRRRHLGEVIDDKSWLFRCPFRWQMNRSEVKGPKWFESTERGSAITPHGINDYVIRSAYAAGIQSERFVGNYPNGTFRRLREVGSGTLRTFWKHQMRMGGVKDPDLLDFMMGHTVSRYVSVHDVYDAEYVRKEYARAEPHLTVTSHASTLESNAPRPSGFDRATTTGIDGIQRIVREGQLKRYLAKKWRFVTTLPSQRIIIERQVPRK